jgi:hypothetical protein
VSSRLRGAWVRALREAMHEANGGEGRLTTLRGHALRSVFLAANRSRTLIGRR